jgi:hypothetical protein
MRQALHAISGLDHLCVECALEGLDQRQSRSWAARRNGSGVRSRSPFCGVDESCPSLDCPAPVSGSPDGYRYCRLTPVSRGNAIREWSGCAPEVPTFVSRHPYGPTSQKRRRLLVIRGFRDSYPAPASAFRFGSSRTHPCTAARTPRRDMTPQTIGRVKDICSQRIGYMHRSCGEYEMRTLLN